MANNLNTNPIIVDTAAAVIRSGQTFIESIVWYGATTGGHSLILKDAESGNVIFGAKVTAANETINAGLSCWVAGIYADTIESGTCLIYTK